MLMTLDSDWNVSVDDDFHADGSALFIRTPKLNATLGLGWLPGIAHNDNLPEWLYVIE